ncbi:trypsin-like serine protease [Salinisphaera sp. USBA-960]|uniref:S1C family serine protease n=1 Tax=Salinisphaera orenii TaxID=856731 RepID=UPI000DBE810D|nr:trypsin-like serine protease [Salifodinibacter halophilus]NNC25427.1 trypsin-like serine protease [Salifodinibacter halophilus]
MTGSNKKLIAVLFVSALATAGPTSALADQNSGGQANDGAKLQPSEANTVKVVKQAKPSVAAINIKVKGKTVNPLANMPPQMRRFFKQFNGGKMQKKQRTERAAGSGFVVDSKGEILTNYHVIANALEKDSTKVKKNATINVQFGSKDKLAASVVGVDQSYDLALLKLKDPDKLPDDADALKFADSNNIQVGEKAIAIGNPFLLQSTVTEGIVSAINREQASKVSGVPISYIQTDAAINPGSSGGPLLNSQGRVIGINDEIFAPHGTFIGVGLAIPSNLVRKNIDELKKGGVIKKAMIGVAVQPLEKYPEEIRQQLNLPDHGLMVVKVKEDGPGDKAGLKGAQFTVNQGQRPWPAGGDIILKANGKPMKSGHALQDIVFSKSAGTKVDLLVQHKDETKEVTVELAVLKSAGKNKRK